MRRVRLYGLLLFSVAVLLWGSDGYAFNRINGIIISHSNFQVTVFLTGSAINADTKVVVSLTVTTEFICSTSLRRGYSAVKTSTRTDTRLLYSTFHYSN
jgi:hypothetical protein